MAAMSGDEKDYYVCNSIAHKLINAVATQAAADGDDVYSSDDEKLLKSRKNISLFGDGYGSSEEEEEESEESEESEEALLAAPAPQQRVNKIDFGAEEAAKLAAAHADLRSNDQYKKELLFHAKEACKLCGKERVTLAAFDDHVCDPKALAPVAVSQPPTVTHSSLWNDVKASLAKQGMEHMALDPTFAATIDRLASKAVQPVVDDDDGDDDDAAASNFARALDAQHYVQKEWATPAAAAAAPTAAATKGADPEYMAQAAEFRAWAREVKGMIDVKGYTPTLGDMVAVREWSNAKKSAASAAATVKLFTEAEMIKAVTTGASFQSSFATANGKPVVVQGKMAADFKSYQVSMSMDATSGKARNVIKFTTHPTTMILSHKVLEKGVQKLHATFDRASVASSLETVLKVAQKITTPQPTAATTK